MPINGFAANSLSVEEFLAARLISTNIDQVGTSANAMIAEAILGVPVEENNYPHDVYDLSRCCATFAMAPNSLKAQMLERLADFCHHVSRLDLYRDQMAEDLVEPSA